MESFRITPVKSATFTIVLLTIISYAISYEQMVVVASKAGIIQPLTFGYGLLLEGFVSVALYTALVCGISWLSVYPWIVAVASFSFSAWINYSAGDVPSGLVRVVAVIAVPVGVHMVAVLKHADSRRKAAATPPPPPVIQTVEKVVERVVEVPQPITPDVDVTTVQEPLAVAYKLMAHFHEHPATRTFNKNRYQEWLDGQRFSRDANVVEMIPGVSA